MQLKWKTSFPVVTEVRLFAKQLAETLRARISEGAMAVGVSVLAHVQKDYETKSRHGTGEDGVQWMDLSEKTLEARVRRRSPAQKIVEERKQIAQEIRGILHGGLTPTRKVTRGKNKGQRVAVPKEVAVAERRKRRETLSKQLNNLLLKELSSYQIGVDQGLQRSSAAPGFDDPKKIWELNASDADGGNIFVVDGGTVTLGYGRSYSAAFDADRPIFPDQLPAGWREDAEKTLHDWTDEVVSEVMGGLGR